MILLSVLEQILIALPLVIGAYLTLSLMKLPDFSIESAYLFGAVAAYIASDLPLPLILASAVGGGMLVGVVVSSLNQFLHIPFLLAAVVVNGLFHGTAHYMLGTSTKSLHIILPFSEITQLLLVACILLSILFVLLRSQLGYSLAIYGNNPQFFQCHPISGRFVMFTGVMIGHGCAGLSGYLFAQANGFVDVTMNFGVILLCLTAMMIGKLLIQARRPKLFVPLIGVALFFILQHSLLRVGFDLKYFNTFQAIFVLGILAIGHRKKALTLDQLGV